ncbi:hypothetical protein GUITHDRAFT_158466 [Guillardia theta CCMP2712]|uniref:GHMP kinase N-terminal domain-containing protein n=1 Tax=Guillardia theta (strain CCMP2712) TaxID=905079 RepID=L1IS44_GUITC|nr:hypothetical protein GUITHDRAFT_158466 [Guillardia theta CCMP2712]EKX38902.1 hypothetical protein GUITHDRAFT_158466 [Guillardia theta CCMP2712]|eukprot:XP_005825882.1 hypothetical protein GUITHDRAFT_158466 [Guillardia theta CCMP2712]
MAGKVDLSVCGRVCLLGEHSDWAGGYRRTHAKILPGRCIVTGTDQTLEATAWEHPNKLILTTTRDNGEVVGPWECDFRDEELLRVAKGGGFWSYAAGVAYQVKTYYPVNGLVVENHTTTLPMKKGLSSSAAYCVLIARAFSKVYDLRMPPRAEMEMAYLGEILTPSRCGRMDQCCAFGRVPTLMFFDGDLLQTEKIDPPKEPIFLVIVDLCAAKDTMEILSCLNKAYPVASNEIEEGVQKLLGEVNEKIVKEAAEVISQGDAKRLGELMTYAQEQFDKFAIPACPSQLTAPKLHATLTHPSIQPLVWGGKGVGSQGDGCAQFVARSEEAQGEV